MVRFAQLRFFTFFTSLAAAVGWKFLFLILFTFCGVRSIAWSITSSGALPYFQSYLKLPESSYQQLSIVIWMPWAIKPWIAGLSDMVPIRRYSKYYYLLLGLVIVAVSLACVGFVPFAEFLSPVVVGVIQCLFVSVSLGAATVDILMEGAYTKIVTQDTTIPPIAPSLVSFVWGCVQGGSLIGSTFIGPLADHVSPRTPFIVGTCVVIPALIAILRNWLNEKPVESTNTIENTTTTQQPNSCCNIQFHLFGANKGIFIVGSSVAAAAVLMAALVLLAPSYHYLRTVIGGIVCIVLGISVYLYLPKPMNKVVLFLLFQEVVYLRIPGALDYWYTANPDCVQDAPHFSYSYYNTWTQIAASLTGFGGIWLFNNYLVNMCVRKGIIITSLLRIVASSFDVIIVKRWNLLVGLNDHWAYMLGDAIIANVVEMMNFMFGTMMLTKSCPKHVETMAFAMIAGGTNFAVMMAALFGEFFMQLFGVTECRYENLALLVFVSHGIPPLLAIAASRILVPAGKLVDNTLTPGGGDIGEEETTHLPSGGEGTDEEGQEELQLRE